MLIKLLIMMFIVAGIGVSTVSCGSNNNTNSTSNVMNNQDSTNVEDKVSEPKKEDKKDMTSAELDEALNNQPVKIIRTEYISQEDQFLRPDLLSAVFQNDSGVDIKNAVLGYVAWDSNNLPVKIQSQYDFTDGEYFKKVNYSDVNLVNGASYGENGGLSIGNDNIAKFKAIVVSYTDFDGNIWDNPLLEEFQKLYEDKKLAE
ncbi:hypothetical protein SFBM_0701 [Candidatus Arthromitus sp. SFB-mouse-Japan]|uniref:DUF5780 domain-containing protein n=1 Tax=Candidatus Arthromitus sp. SFB-mouse TaxID=49118 RepID=UPI00021B80AB|nr:DUF5780 domain-containing protein [Candidatus Arthromitus sp. SFB-mouse]EIA22622.1 hypothetical protein SFB1_269G0 [Candidatus Arthromitus sp. SFB-1]EIA25235.1 hypothetical protein SFB3_135G3 [Candidatus Arthromitus sp. SFB-3]EIA26827.1 Putative response regulator [Candidatus Arthromitus sp. SFB-5]EIA28577.1 hypothetical protein SFB6_039G5 [Candidatus Arthromitus sp. SFB-co]EIA30755.1 hypothetical protein SFBSU_006G436 [Candidatus Arthromitus sp. SFB-mouse-SU]EIA31588.1 hypothetical protei